MYSVWLKLTGFRWLLRRADEGSIKKSFLIFQHPKSEPLAGWKVPFLWPRSSFCNWQNCLLLFECVWISCGRFYMFENWLERKAVAFPSHCFIHTDRAVGMRLTGSDEWSSFSLRPIGKQNTYRHTFEQLWVDFGEHWYFYTITVHWIPS